MFRKGLAVAVILLFIGVAFASSINANVSKSGVEPIADVDVNENVTQIETDYQRIRELVQSIDLRKIIVNPDAVVVSLEEISTIVEENEDCGCEDDSSTLEWRFPVLCTFLYPLWIIAGGILLIFHIFQFMDFMNAIGNNLDCWWA